MLTQVSFRNYKCLRDVTIDLEPFTVFVGANGSGKTSVLQAMDLLCRTFQNESRELESEYQDNHSHLVEIPNPLPLTSKEEQQYILDAEVELSCLADDVWYRYRTLPPHFYQQSMETGTLPVSVGKYYAEKSDAINWKPWQGADGRLPYSRRLRLDPNVMQQPATFNEEYPWKMSSNGEGLHSLSSSMSLESPDRWQKLQMDVRQIIPSIRRLRHTPWRELIFDTINGHSLKTNQVSEGTLLIVGLLAIIHSLDMPKLLLLDDLDRALHPKAQRELIELLRGVQTTNPEIQIIATTHSPYMLDCMKPEEVRMTSLKEDGSTACDALTHHPKFEKWKDEFAPGEMWSFFGEKWVAEGKVMAK